MTRPLLFALAGAVVAFGSVYLAYWLDTSGIWEKHKRVVSALFAMVFVLGSGAFVGVVIEMMMAGAGL